MTATAFILTHHSVPNFGANLQAFATARALKGRGLRVKFVDFRPPELEAKYARGVSEVQRAAHSDFVSDHLEFTRPIENQSDFEALCFETPADLYVSGSDAVFRLDPESSRADLSFPNPYWLVGVPGNERAVPIKAALAPSAMGCDFSRLPSDTRAGAHDALRSFTLLSARDAWTAGQIKGLGVKQDVTLVPDPVFTLAPLLRESATLHHDEKPYIAICTQSRKSSEWVAAFTQLAEAAGYDTLALPTPEGHIDDGTTRQLTLPLSPLDWASAISGAAGYVGGRFHPVIVSLASGKPAVALDLYHAHPFERSRSKTWQIMKRFGISGACHSRAVHRVLPPRWVWHQLKRQMRIHEKTSSKADSLSAEVNDWYDRIVAQVKVGQK